MENAFARDGSEKMTDPACKPEPLPASSCAACKNQRKKCTEKCLLAPYFPQEDAEKFLLVHRVFGYGHVNKLLKDLPATQRGEAVSSMVYEATERLRDPVHGCLGVINDLNKKVAELESQLASTKSALASTESALACISLQYGNLLTLIGGCNEGFDPNFYSGPSPQDSEVTDRSRSPTVVDDVDPLQLWDGLWT